MAKPAGVSGTAEGGKNEGGWRLPPQRSTGDLVVQELRRRIVEGDLADGTRVTEAALAARLGVSRTPVREALARLSATGLLRPCLPSEGSTGHVVVDPLRDIEELVLLREAVEGVAARLAAHRAMPEEKQRLLALAAESRRFGLDALEERNRLNLAFHGALLEAAHAPRLLALAEGFQVFFASPRLLRHMNPAEGEAALAQHEALAAAIERCDAAEAEAIARRHLRTAYARSIGQGTLLQAGTDPPG